MDFHFSGTQQTNLKCWLSYEVLAVPFNVVNVLLVKFKNQREYLTGWQYNSVQLLHGWWFWDSLNRENSTYFSSYIVIEAIYLSNKFLSAHDCWLLCSYLHGTLSRLQERHSGWLQNKACKPLQILCCVSISLVKFDSINIIGYS